MRPRLPLHIPPLLPSFTVVRHLFLCRRFPGLVRQAVWAIFPFKSEFSLSKSAARRRLHYIVPSRLMAARNTSQTRAGKLNGTWHVLSVFRVFAVVWVGAGGHVVDVAPCLGDRVAWRPLERAKRGKPRNTQEAEATMAT